MSAAWTLAGTLSVFGFNAVLAAALAGQGLALRHAFGLRHHRIADCLTAFWAGFGLTMGALLIWNFVLPVNVHAFRFVLVTGFAGLISVRRDRFEAGFDHRLIVLLTAVAFSLWVANLAVGTIDNWDSALYHMQGVKWAHEYPVVPGLANLFGPLGFNNASFLYDAMVGVGPWSAEPWHVSNGVLVSVAGVQAIVAATRLLEGRLAPRLAVPAVLTAPFVIDLAIAGGVTSFSTVVPMSLAVLIASLAATEAFAAESSSDADRGFALFAAVLLGAVAVAIKSSAAVFAAVLTAVCGWAAFRRLADVRVRRRTLAWSLAGAGVIGIAWMWRGVVLSGYPLFPSAFPRIAVDWRAPLEHARAEFDYVVHSARATAENFAYVRGAATGLAAWLPHWGRTALGDWYDIAIPLLMTGAALVSLIIRRRKQVVAMISEPLRSLLVPPIVALIAWWFIAPMPYYAAPYFWLIAVYVAGAAWGDSLVVPESRRRFIAAAVAFGLTPCVIAPGWRHFERTHSAHGLAGALKQANFVTAHSGLFEHAPEPPPMREFLTDSGLTLRVPQGTFGRCWNAPGLCTPNPAPNLRLREPGNVRRGFTVDGEWRMIDWPEPWRRQLLPALRESWRRAER